MRFLKHQKSAFLTAGHNTLALLRGLVVLLVLSAAAHLQGLLRRVWCRGSKTG